MHSLENGHKGKNKYQAARNKGQDGKGGRLDIPGAALLLEPKPPKPLVFCVWLLFWPKPPKPLKDILEVCLGRDGG